MTISFMAYRHDGKYYVYALPYEAAIDMSNANAYDIIDAVGLETDSSGLLPIAEFRNLVTTVRRTRIDHASPAIPLTVSQEPGRCTFINCGRDEGYVERRLEEISALLNQGVEAGATHFGWG